MGDMSRLSACLRKLGGLNLATLNDRKILQKRIYLLQAFGLDLGYRFGWYIYGPYSPDLTRDAFDLSMRLRHASDTMRRGSLTSQEQNTLKKFKTLLSSIRRTNEVAETLELLASIHFLAKEDPSLKTPNEVASKLKELKKDFCDKEIKEGFKQLHRPGLI